jgi:hypothetical protein
MVQTGFYTFFGSYYLIEFGTYSDIDGGVIEC